MYGASEDTSVLGLVHVERKLLHSLSGASPHSVLSWAVGI